MHFSTNPNVCLLLKAANSPIYFTERAKRTLSSATQASIEIDSLANGVDFYTGLSRAKFEELCGDIFARTIGPVERALRDARISKNMASEKLHGITFCWFAK